MLELEAANTSICMRREEEVRVYMQLYVVSISVACVYRRHTSLSYALLSLLTNRSKLLPATIIVSLILLVFAHPFRPFPAALSYAVYYLQNEEG